MVYRWVLQSLDTEQIHHVLRINPSGFMTCLSFKGPETCWILTSFELELLLLDLYIGTQCTGDDYIKDFLSPLRKSIIQMFRFANEDHLSC